jgi:hypothetical protein
MTSDKPEGYVFGRPTKYRKEFCQKLIDHMAEGFSFESFGAIVDTNRSNLHKWIKEHEEFREAKTLAKEKERLWWEKLHRKCADTGEGNATMIVWAQKNKFPKQYYERMSKGQIEFNHKQSLAVTGDFKSLVATMTPEQLYQIQLAIENKTKQLEATNDIK